MPTERTIADSDEAALLDAYRSWVRGCPWHPGAPLVDLECALCADAAREIRAEYAWREREGRWGQ